MADVKKVKYLIEVPGTRTKDAQKVIISVDADDLDEFQQEMYDNGISYVSADNLPKGSEMTKGAKSIDYKDKGIAGSGVDIGTGLSAALSQARGLTNKVVNTGTTLKNSIQAGFADPEDRALHAQLAANSSARAAKDTADWNSRDQKIAQDMANRRSGNVASKDMDNLRTTLGIKSKSGNEQKDGTLAQAPAATAATATTPSQAGNGVVVPGTQPSNATAATTPSQAGNGAVVPGTQPPKQQPPKQQPPKQQPPKQQPTEQPASTNGQGQGGSGGGSGTQQQQGGGGGTASAPAAPDKPRYEFGFKTLYNRLPESLKRNRTFSNWIVNEVQHKSDYRAGFEWCVDYLDMNNDPRATDWLTYIRGYSGKVQSRGAAQTGGGATGEEDRQLPTGGLQPLNKDGQPMSYDEWVAAGFAPDGMSGPDENGVSQGVDVQKAYQRYLKDAQALVARNASKEQATGGEQDVSNIKASAQPEEDPQDAKNRALITATRQAWEVIQGHPAKIQAAKKDSKKGDVARLEQELTHARAVVEGEKFRNIPAPEPEPAPDPSIAEKDARRPPTPIDDGYSGGGYVDDGLKKQSNIREGLKFGSRFN